MWLHKALSAAFTCAVLASAPAGAVSFTANSGSWTLGSGWGPACLNTPNCDPTDDFLNVDWGIDLGFPQNFNLTNPNDSFTFTFGSAIWSEEDNQIAASETNNLGVTGILSFTAPTSTGVNNIAVVIATTGSTNDSAVDLSVSFAPVLVNFGAGNTGQFKVDLSDSTWDCNPGGACLGSPGESNTISATVTLIQLPHDDGNGTIPEPATLALLGIGLAGLGFSRRGKLS